MGKITDLFSVIELQQKRPRSPENVFKIDGKEVKGMRNVKIEFGIDFGLPIVTLEFYAKEIKGAVEGNLTVKEKDECSKK